MPAPIKTAIALLKETAADWYSDNAPRLGASLAYYTVFSVSPLMVIVLAIASFLFGHDAAYHQIFVQIHGLIGDQGAAAVESLLSHPMEAHRGIWATAIAVVTLLIGSTGVFVELQDALNTVWGVQATASSGWWDFVWDRVLSFAMVLAIGFLLLVSLLLSAGLAALGNFLIGLAPEVRYLWQGLNFLTSIGVITLLFALIFKVLPDVKIAWKDVWISAVMTAFLFSLGKFLLGLYLGHTTVASSYGAAGSVVVVLVWVYYSAQILFFGAEFSQVYSHHHGKTLAPVAYAEPIKVEDKIPAALKRRGQVEVPLLSASSTLPAAHYPPKRKRWSVAVGAAALFAWMWLKERRRNRQKT